MTNIKSNDSATPRAPLSDGVSAPVQRDAQAHRQGSGGPADAVDTAALKRSASFSSPQAMLAPPVHKGTKTIAYRSPVSYLRQLPRIGALLNRSTDPMPEEQAMQTDGSAAAGVAQPRVPTEAEIEAFVATPGSSLVSVDDRFWMFKEHAELLGLTGDEGIDGAGRTWVRAHLDTFPYGGFSQLAISDQSEILFAIGAFTTDMKWDTARVFGMRMNAHVALLLRLARADSSHFGNAFVASHGKHFDNQDLGWMYRPIAGRLIAQCAGREMLTPELLAHTINAVAYETAHPADQSSVASKRAMLAGAGDLLAYNFQRGSWN